MEENIIYDILFNSQHINICFGRPTDKEYQSSGRLYDWYILIYLPIVLLNKAIARKNNDTEKKI